MTIPFNSAWAPERNRQGGTAKHTRRCMNPEADGTERAPRAWGGNTLVEEEGPP